MEGAESNEYNEFVQEMIQYYDELIQKHEDIGIGEIIPLLSETYFNGDTTDEKLDEFLNSIDNPNMKDRIKEKLVQLKGKAARKIAELKRALEEKEKAKNLDASKNEKRQNSQIPPPPPVKQKFLTKGVDKEKERTNEPPRKRVKIEKPKFQKKQKVSKGEGNQQMAEQPAGQQQEGEGKEGLKKQLERQGKQKCKFYPFCKNEETCQYFHPTEKVKELKSHLSDQCKYFPNCRNGDTCLYVHEVCKFGQNCTRPSCPYVHQFKKGGNSFQDIFKNFMQGQMHPFKSKRKPGYKPHSQNPNSQAPPQNANEKQQSG